MKYLSQLKVSARNTTRLIDLSCKMTTQGLYSVLRSMPHVCVFLKHMVYAVSVWQKHLCLKYSLTVPCHLAKQCGLFRTNLLWLTTESCMCVSLWIGKRTIWARGIYTSLSKVSILPPSKIHLSGTLWVCNASCRIEEENKCTSVKQKYLFFFICHSHSLIVSVFHFHFGISQEREMAGSKLLPHGCERELLYLVALCGTSLWN